MDHDQSTSSEPEEESFTFLEDSSDSDEDRFETFKSLKIMKDSMVGLSGSAEAAKMAIMWLSHRNPEDAKVAVKSSDFSLERSRKFTLSSDAHFSSVSINDEISD